MTGLLRAEKLARPSAPSTAATAMIDGLFAEGHRDDLAAAHDRPFDSGEDAPVGSAPLVGQHLADEDVCLVGNAVSAGFARGLGAARRSDAVRAVPVSV